MLLFFRGETLRHLYTIFWGMCVLLYVFGESIKVIFMLTIGTYLLMRFSPRKYQHIFVTFFVFAQVTYSHINTYFFNFANYELGITTMSMLLVLRLSSLSWCYRDGAMKDDQLTDK